MAAVACVIAIPRKAIDAFTENRRKALEKVLCFDDKITTGRANRNGDILPPLHANCRCEAMPMLWKQLPMEPIGKIDDHGQVQLFNRGEFPGVEVVRPKKLTDEERDELKRQLQEYYAGRRPEPPPIVIDGLMDCIQPIRPVEMEYPVDYPRQAVKWLDEQIGRIG